MTKAYPLYFDYQATTPVDPEVLEAMLPFFAEMYGNPHGSHRFAWEASAAVDVARKSVAGLIGASPGEIIFTSGATESNNLALRSFAGEHLITLVTEHKSVLEPCRFLESQGVEVTYLPVQGDGLLDLDVLASSIKDNTSLVSVMAVHNEIGVIQPLADIGKICRERGVLFHTDAAQGYGKIPLNVDEMCIDVLSISGHKIYAPKGVGALYVREECREGFEPLFYGGGQEQGRRPGTLPVPLIVGLGKAADRAVELMEEERVRFEGWFLRFCEAVTDMYEGVALNGHRGQRYPGNLSLTVAPMEGNRLQRSMKSFAFSPGAACASGEVSHVLKALGRSSKECNSSYRFGFGRNTKDSDVGALIAAFSENLKT